MTASVDQSARHVLPPASPLVTNLAALWSSDPALAAALERLDDADWLPLEPARSGAWTLAVPNADGRSVYLHSRHRPEEEAAALVAGVNTTERVTFAVLGLGIGHHLAALADAAGNEALIWVFEPDPRVIHAWLRAGDHARLIETRRLQILTTADKGDCFARWNAHLAGISLGFEIVTHEPSVRRTPDFFAAVRQLIDEFVAYGKTTINTLLINGRRTAENLARNIPYYVTTAGVDGLKNAYRDKPAVIVSAGPSLRKNQHLLAEASRGAIVVAVQTTLKPLLDLGVTPDFVTSLDYHDICTRFFEGLPAGLPTELVAEPKASPAVLKLAPGPLSLLGNEFIERVLREMNCDKPFLPAGATVAHLAYYLAEHLGCNPIIFVGQDLGFSDGLCYAPGTSYDDVWKPELSRFCTLEMKQWEQIARDRPILRRVPDHAGRSMYTEERLYAYLQQFERDFLKSGRLIIDASEGGVAKLGAVSMTLAETLARHCGTPLVRLPRVVVERSKSERLAAAAHSVGRRRDEAREIAAISGETLALLREISEKPTDVSFVNSRIALIDALRNRIHVLGHTYDLITQLTQSAELDRYRADRALGRQTDDAPARQRRQLARDIANVTAIRAAAGSFVELMVDAADRIADFAQEASAT